MSAKHTPGPWNVSVDGYIESTDSIIASLCDETESSYANASLIAAAPDLLEALDTLLLVVGLTAFKHEGQRKVLEEAADLARSAIAKATKGKAA